MADVYHAPAGVVAELPSMGEVEGGPVYWIERPSRQRQTWYSSLAEVLVAALEAAP